MMRAIYIILFMIASLSSFAQTRKTDLRILDDDWRFSTERKFRTWSVSAGYGASYMFADISTPSFKNFYGSPSVIVSKHLWPGLAIDLQYLYSEMGGFRTTSLTNFATRLKESEKINFKGDFHEISLSGAFYLNQIFSSAGPIKDRWNFYLKIGAGTAFFRSKLYHADGITIVRQGEFYENEKAFYGGNYLVTGYDKSDGMTKIARKSTITFMPATHVGIMYRINNSFDIHWETSIHISLSDHFDTILKGNSNDNPFYTGLFLSYKIGKKGVRHQRWTYRGYGFNLFGRPKKDPIFTEIALLEEAIRKAEENRPISIHTVEITTSETLISQPTFIRTIFFPKDGDKKFSDTNIVKDEELVSMAEVVVQMRYNPEAILYVYGHVDKNTPGDHYEISRKECEKIVDYIVNILGGSRENIQIVPRGSEDQIAIGNEAPNQLIEKSNRRVDLVIRLQ